VKLPVNVRHRGVRLKVLAQEAIDWYINHGQKDVRSFKSRMSFIVEAFGERIADEIKPSEIDTWLGAHDWAPATKNRYKSVLSKTFKIALADGKVSSNPARLVQQRPENNARIRFLSNDEEKVIRAAISKRCPRHMEELDIALNTGMRKSEQYSLEWPEVSFRRKRIRLDETKNGSGREIPMNKTCLTALEALYARRPHDGRVCQSKYGEDLNDSRKWFELVIRRRGEANTQPHGLHLALPAAHVYQPPCDEGSRPADSAGIGWAQNDFHDGSLCASCSRAQSGGNRETRR
jgi:integrase